MTRDELDQLMLLYASGAADDADRALAEARLCACDPAAQAAYAEAIVVVNAMPLALPRKECPKQVRDQLLFRVTAGLQGNKDNVANDVADSVTPWRFWSAAAIAAVLAIGLTLTIIDRQKLRTDLAQSKEILRGFRSVMSSPHASLASLKSEAGTGTTGRVLYCPVQNEYEVVVFNLAPPGPGKVYELWLITPENKKLPAGTFVVDARGSGTINVSVPRTTIVAVAAITDEPIGGSDVPTGSIHLVGNLQNQ